MNVILWHCFWWPDARSPFATLDASWSESARTIAETETKTEKNGRVQTKWNYANFCGVGELASLRHLHRKKSINFIKSKTHLIFSISRAHYSWVLAGASAWARTSQTIPVNGAVNFHYNFICVCSILRHNAALDETLLFTAPFVAVASDMNSIPCHLNVVKRLVVFFGTGKIRNKLMQSQNECACRRTDRATRYQMNNAENVNKTKISGWSWPPPPRLCHRYLSESFL